MKTLLSLLLSASILVSSVTPSLAQLIPAGRQVVKGVVQSGAEAAAGRTGKQLLEGAVKQGISASPSVAAATRFSSSASSVPLVSGVPAVSSVASSDLRLAVDRTIQQQLALTGNDIRALVKAGEVEGLAARILTHSNPAFRAGLLRNEFVTLSLKGGATADQIAQAVKFYRGDIVAASDAFARLPEGDLASVLRVLADKNHSAYSAVLQCHGALADAGALGLLGSKADAAALLQFYKQASQSVFKDSAAVIAARGLLRQGAYKELSELAALAKPEGAFWTELSAFAKEQGLPVEISALPAANPAEVPAELSGFLKSGCQPNGLNADVSRQATEAWLTLGSVKPAVRPAAQPVRESVPALSVELPEVTLAGADLSLSPMSVPAGTGAELAAETAAAPPAQTQLQQKTVQFFAKSTPAASSSASGMLYSGLPIPEMGKMFKKAASWIRSRFRRPEPVAPYEEPGLHDDTQIRAVYKNLRSPEVPASADEVISGNEFGPVPVSETGFKLTLVDQSGVERILPVNLEISNRFRVKGYNRIAFAVTPEFKNGYIAELRNQEQEPLRMSHFYMRLQSNQVGALADLISAAGLSKFSLKLESTPDVAYKTMTLPVYDLATSEKLPLEVDVPVKSFSPDTRLVIMENGGFGMLTPGSREPVALSNFYVRLPKNQIGNFVEILSYSPTAFNVSVHPTQNRADLIIRDASLTNVSLGKTMGPVVNNALDMNVNTANSMMFTINYILPGLASLLTPVLKKYGEKKLMVLSLAMSTAAGALASAGGFYGFVEGLTLGPVSKGMFIAALFLMSGSSILKQLVSNMLIRANRGEAILDAAKEAVKKSETEFTAVEKQGFERMGRRLHEFFTKKSDVSLKDVVLYNLSFVYKNVGTLAFLASPYLINRGIRWVTGVDLGLDYSISFPIYAVYSGTVAWKVWRAKLRDAYSAKNLIQSQQMLQNTLDAGVRVLAGAEGKVSHTLVDDVARGFKDSLDALVFADMKLDPSKKKSVLYDKAKASLLADLQSQLISRYQVPVERAQDLTDQVRASLSVQENTLGNMFKMLKAPGVTALASAMTLATVHEFVVSSAFSTTMKELIKEGEFANFLVACSLYVPLIVGRLGGNVISRRISADTMYILCSGLSALGTGIMATAGGSVAQMISGAAVASFGVGNFFTQMYDYIMNRYPKQNRELSSILALTMALGGIGAIPAGYLASVTGFDPASLVYAGGALAASLILTPAMMAKSTLVQGVKYESKRLWAGVKKLFKRGNNNHPGNLDDAASAQ